MICECYLSYYINKTTLHFYHKPYVNCVLPTEAEIQTLTLLNRHKVMFQLKKKCWVNRHEKKTIEALWKDN